MRRERSAVASNSTLRRRPLQIHFSLEGSCEDALNITEGVSVAEAGSGGIVCVTGEEGAGRKRVVRIITGRNRRQAG